MQQFQESTQGLPADLELGADYDYEAVRTFVQKKIFSRDLPAQ